MPRSFTESGSMQSTIAPSWRKPHWLTTQGDVRTSQKGRLSGNGVRTSRAWSGRASDPEKPIDRYFPT